MHTSPLIATLLPAAWFESLSLLLLLVFGVIALVILLKGADYLVEGAAGLAERLGLPKIVIGATILSLGTTSPEAAVSVLAAVGGEAGLALGNGVGSIIADTGLIFGAGLVLARLPADPFLLNRQGWVQFGSAAALAALCYGLWAVQGDAATIGRVSGVIFTLALIAYLLISVRWARQQKVPGLHGDDLEPIGVDAAEPPHADPMWRNILFAIGGLLAVIVAGDAFVQCASITAERAGVPESVLASTLVAFGTSLPELVTGITAIRRGHPELLVGNVIGADILNVLFVIGLSALAADLPILDPEAPFPAVFLLAPIPTMMLMLIVMRVYITRAVKVGHFSRWMGVPLLGLYVAYLVVSYLLARPPA